MNIKVSKSAVVKAIEIAKAAQAAEYSWFERPYLGRVEDGCAVLDPYEVVEDQQQLAADRGTMDWAHGEDFIVRSPTGERMDEIWVNAWAVKETTYGAVIYRQKVKDTGMWLWEWSPMAIVAAI